VRKGCEVSQRGECLMSVFEFLVDFFVAAKELFLLGLDLALGILKAFLLALNEILFVFPQAYIFWGMVALVLVLIMGDTMNKSLQADQRRHEREYRRQLRIKQEIETRQAEKELERKAAEERAKQIRQSLRLPVGVIKQQQARRHQKNSSQRHH